MNVKGIREDDKIILYATRRCISTCMAMWKVYEYKILRMHLVVRQPPIHLKEKQIVRYQLTTKGAASTIVRESQTKLTGFFDACYCLTRRELTSTLKYEDFPLKFFYDTTSRTWNIRQRMVDSILRRIVNIHPRTVEEFHMRFLLNHITTSTSFKAPRTVEGVEHRTYKEACVALELC